MKVPGMKGLTDKQSALAQWEEVVLGPVGRELYRIAATMGRCLWCVVAGACENGGLLPGGPQASSRAAQVHGLGWLLVPLNLLVSWSQLQPWSLEECSHVSCSTLRGALKMPMASLPACV